MTRLPGDSVSLASSPLCAVQAFRVGRHAYGLQYHVELTPTTVADWGRGARLPGVAGDRTLGPDGLAPFEAEAARNMPAFNRDARILYDNFVASSAAVSASSLGAARGAQAVGRRGARAR